MTNASWIGLRELQAAIRRSPQRVLKEARLYLTRGIAEYKRGIIRQPWRKGGSGGGAPVKTGNLRDAHTTRISGLTASIGPSQTNRYARFVHEGTRFMKGRPWLDYVKRTKEDKIQEHYRVMHTNIVRDLAK